MSILVLTSCSSNDKNQKKVDNDKVSEAIYNTSSSNRNKNFIRIEIKYWNGHVARLHRMEYSDDVLVLYCDEDNFKHAINDKVRVNQLVDLIQQFYIKKSDKIILSKKKLNMVRASNFSSIQVKIMDKEKLLADRKTQIGSEEYEIEFNPEFIKLYQLIQKLTSFCEKI